MNCSLCFGVDLCVEPPLRSAAIRKSVGKRSAACWRLDGIKSYDEGL